MTLPTLGAGPSAAADEVWTPSSPTTDGGVSPHTWFYTDASILYQDSGKTTPVTSDGDPVGAAENQGSDSYDVTQGTTAAKPTYKTGIKNSQAVMRLDGGDSLGGAFGGGAISQPFTKFIVAQLDASAVNDDNNHYIMDSDDASNRDAAGKRSAGTPDPWLVYNGASLVGGAADSNWNIWTELSNGASSEFWLNGVSEASGNAGTDTPDGITIAAGQGGAVYHWVGDAAEILIYSGNLSDADKIEVQGYLSTKYDIAVGDYTT